MRCIFLILFIYRSEAGDRAVESSGSQCVRWKIAARLTCVQRPGCIRPSIELCGGRCIAEADGVYQTMYRSMECVLYTFGHDKRITPYSNSALAVCFDLHLMLSY